jgi:hypothetical protein
MNVSVLDLHAGYLELKDELDAAYHRVLNSGWHILGEEVERFEADFATSTTAVAPITEAGSPRSSPFRIKLGAHAPRAHPTFSSNPRGSEPPAATKPHSRRPPVAARRRSHKNAPPTSHRRTPETPCENATPA